ncbi:50S ribosomal protein L18Ae [Haloferacaceae archaeon DSL9]
MSQFTVSGTFQSRGGSRPFSKRVGAVNENVAREHVLSKFGSEHGLKRTQVTIEEVSEE